MIAVLPCTLFPVPRLTITLKRVKTNQLRLEAKTIKKFFQKRIKRIFYEQLTHKKTNKKRIPINPAPSSFPLPLCVRRGSRRERSVKKKPRSSRASSRDGASQRLILRQVYGQSTLATSSRPRLSSACLLGLPVLGSQPITS